MTSLTPTQEDYIEAVYRSESSSEGGEGMRVTDLAAALDCRRPTVTRTVRVLSDAGFLAHRTRGRVRLTARGRRIARDIAHRHDDVVDLLVQVLGLTPDEAEADACQIEHGLSALAATRLHAFLELFATWPEEDRRALRRAVVEEDGADVFNHLVDVRASGWRA